MCEDRQKFFRPWNSAEESQNAQVLDSNLETSDNEDNSSTSSSSYSSKNYNFDVDSARLESSSSVGSVEEINTTSNCSLRSLNNFVEKHQLSSDGYPLNCTLQNEQLLAQQQMYNCQDWPMIPFGPNYMWVPNSYHSMQAAVDQIKQQEAQAKQIKKLRPKKFRCRFCNVAFSNMGQLSGHERIHTGKLIS